MDGFYHDDTTGDISDDAWETGSPGSYQSHVWAWALGDNVWLSALYWEESLAAGDADVDFYFTMDDGDPLTSDGVVNYEFGMISYEDLTFVWDNEKGSYGTSFSLDDVGPSGDVHVNGEEAGTGIVALTEGHTYHAHLHGGVDAWGYHNVASACCSLVLQLPAN